MNTKTVMKKTDPAEKPDHVKIYHDMITKKFPKKIEECKTMLVKKKLSALDIINLNHIIFGTGDHQTESFNQKHKSYDQASILMMLNYQKLHKLNNSQLSDHFKVSRNSVTKWKKMLENKTKPHQ